MAKEKKKIKIPKCEKCGRSEEHPVAAEHGDDIIWICWNCYRVEKGK